MYKIFWTPATDPSKPATIIIDGQLAEYTGKEEQNLAMVKFGEVRQWPCEKAISEQKGDGRKFSKDLFIAVKPADIIEKLTDSEKSLAGAIKKQTPKDKIKVYDLGEYKIFACIADKKSSALKWQKFGAESYKKIKNSREIKVAIYGFDDEAYFNFAFGLELAGYRFDKYFTKKEADFYPSL